MSALPNATITIPYEDFQKIKNKADLYEKKLAEEDEWEKKRTEFIETLCECIEKGATSPDYEEKQYYLCQGLQAICKEYDMNMAEDYGVIEQGAEPGKVKA